MKTPGIGYYDLEDKSRLTHPKIIKNIKIKDKSFEKFNLTSTLLDEIDMMETFKSNKL